MTLSPFAQIGVCIPPAPPRNVPRTVSYPHYIHEILGHAGLCYRTIESENLAFELGTLRLLVTVGEADWPEPLQTALSDWVRAGGTWLAIGGACGLPELFGLAPRTPVYSGAAWGGQSATLGEGYLQVLDATHPALGAVPLPLHFFNGVALDVAEGGQDSGLARHLDAHGRAGTSALMMEQCVGAGRCFLITPDVIGAIVRIQQGVAITRDGVSASDGSGSVTDGVLKCDDGAVLDWTFDRQEVPGVAGLSCFLEPIADHWRTLLLRAIFYLAGEAKVPLVLLWLYPRNLPALAHLSFDSDHNVPSLARTLLQVTAEAEVSATWCIILPGYEPDIRQAIRGAGHELAVHYDALEHPWGEAEFARQWSALCAQFGKRPVSNKNHFTRWEGDTEFFEWCARRGVQLDGSKGPSKFGEAGFLFGTCHPYFPLAPRGEVLDVLELPFLSQDLEVFVPKAVITPFLASVLKVHGVMHLLFHPNHIERTGVAASLQEAVRRAREAGLEWWTSRQINDWERARRQVEWEAIPDSSRVSLRSRQPLPEATLLVLNPEGCDVTINGQIHAGATATRWGFAFTAFSLNVEAGKTYALALQSPV